MKKYLTMFFLAMFLGIFAIGCGPSVKPAGPPTPEPEDHEAAAEHDAGAPEHAAE